MKSRRACFSGASYHPVLTECDGFYFTGFFSQPSLRVPAFPARFTGVFPFLPVFLTVPPALYNLPWLRGSFFAMVAFWSSATCFSRAFFICSDFLNPGIDQFLSFLLVEIILFRKLFCSFFRFSPWLQMHIPRLCQRLVSDFQT